MTECRAFFVRFQNTIISLVPKLELGHQRISSIWASSDSGFSRSSTVRLDHHKLHCQMPKAHYHFNKTDYRLALGTRNFHTPKPSEPQCCKTPFYTCRESVLKTERTLWDMGICSWDAFCDESMCAKSPFSSKKSQLLRGHLDQCRERLCACDPPFFARSLPTQHLWRLFSEFRDCAAYIDIETTGLGGPYDHITTAAIYDGRNVSYYVYGDNLDLFPEDLSKYKILISYNGSCFDLPFIRGQFGVPLDQVHIDLRFLLGSLGYRGGLKGCEKKLGLDRAELDGVDGYFAVLLWEEYRKKRNSKALETLLAYNITDTVNLENLMVQAYNLKIRETPFHEEKLLLPCPPQVPFQADVQLVSRLRDFYFSAF